MFDAGTAETFFFYSEAGLWSVVSIVSSHCDLTVRTCVQYSESNDRWHHFRILVLRKFGANVINYIYESFEGAIAAEQGAETNYYKPLWATSMHYRSHVHVVRQRRAQQLLISERYLVFYKSASFPAKILISFFFTCAFNITCTHHDSIMRDPLSLFP